MAVEQAEALGLDDVRVVVEPMGRDTAPAILAAALMLESTPDDLMLVAPSDHVMTDIEAFHMRRSRPARRSAADDGALVTFGVTPDRPETGYGYLQLAGRPDGRDHGDQVHRESPIWKLRRTMLEAGHYLWNGGMFMGRVRDFIAAFETHAPELIDPGARGCQQGQPRPGASARLDEGGFGARRGRFRWITRSWKRPTGWWPCRWIAAGPIWGPGTRFGMSSGPDAKGQCDLGRCDASGLRGILPQVRRKTT